MLYGVAEGSMALEIITLTRHLGVALQWAIWQVIGCMRMWCIDTSLVGEGYCRNSCSRPLTISAVTHWNSCSANKCEAVWKRPVYLYRDKIQEYYLNPDESTLDTFMIASTWPLEEVYPDGGFEVAYIQRFNLAFGAAQPHTPFSTIFYKLDYISLSVKAT